MSVIYDNCPNKHRLVSTGFEANLKTFSSLPGVPTPYNCEACGEIHIMLMEDAEVAPILDGRIESRYQPTVFKMKLHLR